MAKKSKVDVEELDEKKVLKELKEHYDLGKMIYAPIFRRMRMLDLTDKGKFWEAIGAKFPPYQILPDTPFITYIKNNLLASLYTVSKTAEVVPTSQDDVGMCTDVNIAMEHIWDVLGVANIQFEAGERAALLNLGITQVGWNETITGGTEDTFIKGDIELKNVDPMKFMRDPYSANIDEASWCCTYESLPKSVLMANKHYKEKFKDYCEKNQDTPPDILPSDDAKDTTRKNYFNLIVFWTREEDGKINEYHTIDLKTIVYHKKDIQPSTMPFAELYYNLPHGDPVGVSQPAKQFSNQVTYNLLDSIAYTSIYKNQFPPKFISASSGININAFAKHGAEADKTFIVQGDPKAVVFYHQFPEISNMLPSKQQALYDSIQEMSGVDGRYTGRDTGSIITTGGTQEMLNRVTLSDAPAIMTYENYTKQLTKLILGNLLNFAPKRKYFAKDKIEADTWTEVSIDFPNIDNDTLFEYALQISSEMPKNKQRVQAWANTMMEKQMQYQQQGQQVDLITNEEWLQMQDVPYKEQMMERMGLQRATDALQEAGQVIDEYAQMIGQGLHPDAALENAAMGLQNKRAGEPTPLQAGGLDQQLQGGGPPVL